MAQSRSSMTESPVIMASSCRARVSDNARVSSTGSEASRAMNCAWAGFGTVIGSRRGRFQLKSHPGLRLSQQTTAKRAQGTTSQIHQDDRHRLFIDKHTLKSKMHESMPEGRKYKSIPIQ
jgi:hypothetical protein